MNALTKVKLRGKTIPLFATLFLLNENRSYRNWITVLDMFVAFAVATTAVRSSFGMILVSQTGNIQR